MVYLAFSDFLQNSVEGFYHVVVIIFYESDDDDGVNDDGDL